MKNAISAILILLLVVSAGCSHNVALNPRVRLNTYLLPRYTTPVGIIIPDNVKSYTYKCTRNDLRSDDDDDEEYGDTNIFEIIIYSMLAAIISGMFEIIFETRYCFDIGEQLYPILLRSTNVAYNGAVEMKDEEEYDLDRVIMFSLPECYLDLSLTASTQHIANCAITIGVDVFDAQEVVLLKSTTLTGIGVSDGSDTDSSAEDAIEEALQEIADELSELLASGYAE